jgi:hypothetical protein
MQIIQSRRQREPVGCAPRDPARSRFVKSRSTPLAARDLAGPARPGERAQDSLGIIEALRAVDENDEMGIGGSGRDAPKSLGPGKVARRERDQQFVGFRRPRPSDHLVASSSASIPVSAFGVSCQDSARVDSSISARSSQFTTPITVCLTAGLEQVHVQRRSRGPLQIAWPDRPAPIVRGLKQRAPAAPCREADDLLLPVCRWLAHSETACVVVVTGDFPARVHRPRTRFCGEFPRWARRAG